MNFQTSDIMKEKLTKDIIKIELKKIYLHDVIKYSFLLLLSVAYLVFYHFKPQLSIYNPKSVVLLLSPIYIYAIVIGIINFFKIFKAYRLTQNNEIDIVTDILVDKSKKTALSRYRGFHYTYTLLFEKSGQYKLKKHILKISNPYGMENERLYNTSHINDEFYIVSVGKWNNILAYNKELFEFNEV